MIPRPEWFTLEKYRELKYAGTNDIYIANELLFVSVPILNRFKKEIGWDTNDNPMDVTKPRYPDKLVEIIELREIKKKKYKEISKILNIPISTVQAMYQKHKNLIK